MTGRLLAQPVEEVMSRNPRVIKGDVLASAAMEFMQTTRSPCCSSSTKTGAPAGILHIHDSAARRRRLIFR